MTAPTPIAALPAGNVKVTRDDWLRCAIDILVSDGIGEVKVLRLAQRLEVSRSSFYWYFGSRQDLLDALLDHWDATNTAPILDLARTPQPSITAAVANVFRAWVDRTLFDPRLDFAIRDWSRRAGAVRRRLDRSDEARLGALASMFERHGYDPAEAGTRARILYFTQIGYYSLELGETLEDRLARVRDYLLGFTGIAPAAREVEGLRDLLRAAGER